MSWVFCSMILRNGPNLALESGFWAGLWGENSVTDNPYDPCDHESSLLVAMQCLAGVCVPSS